MARELVEAERERLLAKEQRLGEELNVVNEELRTQNDALVQHQMVLAAQNAELEDAREEAARLFEKQRDLFLRLQEALLDIPKELPGVRFGHLYRSATEEAKIGGDFYDVFEAKNGKVGLLIGDVSGHGINAARIASLTKDTIRAFSHQFRRPHLVLRETNRLLIQRNLTGFVTVFLGFLDPESGILVHSSAGHPPPILVADGSATTIESIGSPLGVFPTSRYRDNDSRLNPGSIVVLYTDGITEARRENLFFGDRGLLEAVLAISDHSAEELPPLLLERALEFSRGMLADDVALLAVQYEGPTKRGAGA
jgi:serine phosphatase RsbU (regulator of sigma subunit)